MFVGWGKFFIYSYREVIFLTSKIKHGVHQLILETNSIPFNKFDDKDNSVRKA